MEAGSKIFSLFSSGFSLRASDSLERRDYIIDPALQISLENGADQDH